MQNVLPNLARGGLAGTAATLPMSVAMLGLTRCLPFTNPRSLPPHQITFEAVRNLGGHGHVNQPTGDLLTTLAHFGYGASMGALFGAVCGGRPTRPVTQGIGFGLAVWGGSYCGWLPAIDSQAAAEHQGLSKNAVMIASHVVWGASLGLLYKVIAAPTSPPTKPATTTETPAHPAQVELAESSYRSDGRWKAGM